MRKLTILAFVAVFLNSSLYSQVYCESIGEAAEENILMEKKFGKIEIIN